MKKINYVILLFALLLLPVLVEAQKMASADLPNRTYIIGTHLFNSSRSEKSDLYDGVVNSAVVMLGASSIDTSSYTKAGDFIIYYKSTSKRWINSITGDIINEKIPEYFEITHINGVPVETVAKVKFFAYAGLEDVFTTTTISIPYGSTIPSDKIPVLKNRPGYTFVCWTLKDEDDCFSMDTQIDLDQYNGKLDPSDEENNVLILEPKYQMINYEITYNSNYGTPTTYVNRCTYGSLSNVNDDCKFSTFVSTGFTVRPNYRFVGWSTTSTGDIIYGEEQDMGVILRDKPNITLYAIWEPVSYRVSYKLEGGTFGSEVSPVTSFTVETTSISLNTPVKVGYDFVEWQSGGTRFDGTSLPANDVVLTAVWRAHTYTFVYDGETYGNCEYGKDCLISQDFPDSKLPAGRKFVGWSVGTGDDKILLPKSVRDFTTDDRVAITMNPEYELIQYNVIYDYDHGSVATNNVAKVTYDDINKANNIKIQLYTPTKVGYTFSNYTVTSGNATIDGANKMTITGAGDVYVKATYDVIRVTINYTSDGVAYGDSVTCDYNDCVIKGDDPTKEGYIFEGWKTSSGQIYVGGDRLRGTGVSTLNLEAKWTKKFRHTVEYDLDGGYFVGDPLNPSVQPTPTTTFLDGEIVHIIPAAKVGYTFVGWDVDGVMHTEANPVFTSSNDVVHVTAKWKAIEYTVEFFVVGSPNTKIGEVVCTFDQECQLPDLSSDSHFNSYNTLKGWSTEAGMDLFYGNAIKVMNLSNVDGDIVPLYAYTSDEGTYATLYRHTDTEGVTINPKVSVHRVGETVTLADLNKVGYRFLGWFVDGTTQVTGGSITITSNTLVIAKFEPIPVYNVTFDLGYDDLILTTQQVYENETATEPTAPTRAGYVFTGWKYGTDDFNFNTQITSPITLVASWRTATHTVTFDFGTAATETQIVDDGDTATDVRDPSVVLLGFLGWYQEINGVVSDDEFDFSTPIYSDITLVAKWNTIYNVSFDAANGEVVTTVQVEEGTTISAPTDPVKTGCRFLGWYNGAVLYDFDDEVYDNIDLVAHWVQRVTVTFNPNNGDPTSNVVIDINTTVAEPTEPEYEGYIFEGWYTSDDQPFDFDDTISGNIVLTAKWTEDTE